MLFTRFTGRRVLKMTSDIATTFEGEIDLGIIGGTGLYNLECLKVTTTKDIEGHPSINKNFHVAFISRHGLHHEYPPTKVPFRANMAALKHLKCKAVLSFSAVGSLQHHIRPRDFVLPQQIIDRTKGIRDSSYYNDEGLVGHVGFGNPFSEAFAKYIYQFKDNLVNKGDHCTLHFNKDITVICMEGPQFSTRAESKMYRLLGGDVINMSVIPEAKLARECELPYQMVCMSTDYDAWKDEEEPVTVETVIGHLTNNGMNANVLASCIIESMAHELPEFMVTGDGLKNSVKMSISTKPEGMSKETLNKLRYLFPDYW